MITVGGLADLLRTCDQQAPVMIVSKDGSVSAVSGVYQSLIEEGRAYIVARPFFEQMPKDREGA